MKRDVIWMVEVRTNHKNSKWGATGLRYYHSKKEAQEVKVGAEEMWRDSIMQYRVTKYVPKRVR